MVYQHRMLQLMWLPLHLGLSNLQFFACCIVNSLLKIFIEVAKESGEGKNEATNLISVLHRS